jgi:cytochrome c oxidase subunit 3
MATVAMLFTAFLSAYLVRRVSADWRSIPLPPLVWVNTSLLLASSAALELARARRRAGGTGRRWLAGAALLGAAFLGGQALVWMQLAAEGWSIPASPHSAFFHIFTALHALHLVGGLVLLTWLLGRRGAGGAVQPRLAHGPGEGASSSGLSPAASGTGPAPLLAIGAGYWHFLAALWLILLAFLILL